MGFGSELSKIDDELSSNSGEAWRSVTQEMADSLIVHRTAEKRVKKISQYVKLGIANPIIYSSLMTRGEEEKGDGGLKSLQKIMSFPNMLPRYLRQL